MYNYWNTIEIQEKWGKTKVEVCTYLSSINQAHWHTKSENTEIDRMDRESVGGSKEKGK
jgi:hypothetical protein